jgi:molybdenum cofactor cytidylyltransferase
MSELDEAATLHAIVLAAGASSRFGSPKQLVRVDGRPLLHSAVSRAVEVAGHAVSVVLGANAAELAPLLSHSSASIVINREWAEGMASSIRAGVSRLPGSCTGVMLVLADQAAVTAADLRRLAMTWRRQPGYIVAAQYGATLGAPAVFPSSTFRDLSELRGDRGAQVLFKRNPDRVIRVPMESAAIDIDTPEDLLRLDPARR